MGKIECISAYLAKAFSLLLSITLVFPMVSSAEPLPSKAPLNPAFLNHFSSLKIKIQQSSPQASHTYGYIPPPVDYSYLKNLPLVPQGIAIQKSVLLPVTYDLRTEGKVTPVKDQGNCGACWSFASISSLESGLLMGSPTIWDFSENNLKNTSGFDWGPCEGGNSDMAIAYMSRWDGPVNETADPYYSDFPYDISYDISPDGLTVRKHLQQALIIPPPTDYDLTTIKETMMQYGALKASYYDSDSNAYYNAVTYGYYYTGPALSSNHAITLVGWDDNYAASNFPTTPSGNGAFIVKNSWGTWWGQSGYFYISYYDKFILDDIYAFSSAVDPANNSRIYQYDPLGKIGDFGYSDVTSAWGANVFTAAASESVSAIAFYAASPLTTYTIKIYTNSASGPTSTLAHTQTGFVNLPGYHTITLTNPVAVTSGQKFSVVMLLDTPGYYRPIPIEYYYSGYSSEATAGPGQSYYAYNYGGEPGEWSDITTWDSSTNICIKAFTAAIAAMTSPTMPFTFTGTSQTFTWNNVGAISYGLDVGSSVGASNISTYRGVSTSRSVTTLPVDGSTVYVRLYTQLESGWVYKDYTYTAALKAAMTSPAPSSTLTGTSQLFSWTNTGATAYQIHVGTTGVGSANIGYFPNPASTATSANVAGLPANGSTVYVRLYSLIGGAWQYNDYQYTAYTAPAAKATMTSPAGGATLTGTSQLFSWTNTGATAYQIHVGTTGVGSANIGYFPNPASTATSANVGGLPANGSTVYVRLYSLIGGAWQYNDYQYTAYTAPTTKATMTSPAGGATLTGTSQLFSWTNTGATAYQIHVGTTGVGSANIGYFPNPASTATSANVGGLPANGSAVYVRLYSLIGGAWQYNDYQYTAFGS